MCTTMMDTVQHIPQVVVARVHALATAAGCQLVATCDLAVAAESASFAIPGGKGGLFCHTPLVAVARNVGRKRALRDGAHRRRDRRGHRARLGADERAWCPTTTLVAATADLLRRATRGSAASKGLGKLGFYAQVGLPQDDAYAFAVELMAEAATLPDAQEASPRSSTSAVRRSPRVPARRRLSPVPPRGIVAACATTTTTHPGYTADKQQLLARLRRIEGQVRGLQRMIDEDTYCIDVLTQVAAVSKALQGVGLQLLDEHLHHCVAGAAASGDNERTESLVHEATKAVERLFRA